MKYLMTFEDYAHPNDLTIRSINWKDTDVTGSNIEKPFDTNIKKTKKLRGYNKNQRKLNKLKRQKLANNIKKQKIKNFNTTDDIIRFQADTLPTTDA